MTGLTQKGNNIQEKRSNIGIVEGYKVHKKQSQQALNKEAQPAETQCMTVRMSSMHAEIDMK